MTTAKDCAIDQLAILMAGTSSQTLAHQFLEHVSRYPLVDLKEAYWRGRRFGEVRIFMPSREKDRILYFPDQSGVYVHDTLFCTPMGADISDEIKDWKEMK